MLRSHDKKSAEEDKHLEGVKNYTILDSDFVTWLSYVTSSLLHNLGIPKTWRRP